jgi:hypothetical protein
MDKHLEHLATRLEDDPFFLACALKHFARSEGLSSEQLAAALGCSADTLLLLRLCRAPASDDEAFSEGIEQITTRFSVDADVLAEAVRRGQALCAMTRDDQPQRTLLAARDGDTEEATDEGSANP